MDREDHVQLLKLAEQQFRFACTARFNAAMDRMPLDVPIERTFGSHRASWDEFGLRKDQVEYAAPCLEYVSTFVMTSAIRQAFAECVPDVKNHENSEFRSAYQVARLIRNAFAHHMLRPVWSIDANCRNQLFQVESIISIDTTDLNGKVFSWTDYGGPLAIWRLSQWTRFNVLDDRSPANRVIPDRPVIDCWQQGEVYALRIGDLPEKSE